MSYQATTRSENPFQQMHNTEEENEDYDEDGSQHNIKFTIPPNNNEKGKFK